MCAASENHRKHRWVDFHCEKHSKDVTLKFGKFGCKPASPSTREPKLQSVSLWIITHRLATQYYDAMTGVTYWKKSQKIFEEKETKLVTFFVRSDPRVTHSPCWTIKNVQTPSRFSPVHNIMSAPEEAWKDTDQKRFLRLSTGELNIHVSDKGLS